nr:MAG TPA: hypothetical protein [Caudoviricetes sp.]
MPQILLISYLFSSLNLHSKRIILAPPLILDSRRPYMLAWICYLILKFIDSSHSFTADA